MKFINEYVSDDDRKIYRLDEKYKEYAFNYHPDGFPKRTKFQWTKSDDGKCFLIRFSRGREEYSNCSRWMLIINSLEFRVELALCDGSSLSFSDSPYRQVIELRQIEGDFKKQKKEKVLSVLKDALDVFGSDGVRRQIPNTVNTYNF